jgi:multiple sugar transport system permease protein
MMLPGAVVIIPRYLLYNQFSWVDTYMPFYVPAALACNSFFTYMLIQFLRGIPRELDESAYIDGCGTLRTLWAVLLPLMKPAIAVQAIFTFVSSWNNYFTPALILHKDTMKTLPILIAQLRSADFLKFNMGHVYAAVGFSIFPVIIVYLLLSRYIVGGTTLGGVKG